MSKILKLNQVVKFDRKNIQLVRYTGELKNSCHACTLHYTDCFDETDSLIQKYNCTVYLDDNNEVVPDVNLYFVEV